MGRIREIAGVLALILVSRLAAAEPRTDGASPQARAPAVAHEPAPPRVIWAEAGQAPERPKLRLPADTSPRRHGFGLGDVRWVIGLERASTFTGYRSTISDNGSDIVTSGVEASIVGSASQEAFSPLVLPRLALDRRWANGFSFGFVASYAAHSAERSSDAKKATLPSSESALLGARIGWLSPLSRNVSLWLRGGPTWARRASSGLSSEPGVLTSVDQQWAISLEPQLVILPVRHFGLSLGGAVDLGFGDEKLTRSGGSEPGVSRTDKAVTTYGITAGLLALF